MKNKIFSKRRFLFILFAILMTVASIAAQTTAFTFQGRLNTSGNPASGNYEMQFQLFDAVKGGAQIGATVTDPNVGVVNGVFTTTLDFGAPAFDGSARFVEIGMRPAGNTDPFTILAPRQTVKSSPYSIQSKNAATADALSANCVNCVTSGQILSVDGSQVTGAIPPASVPMGSNNYIQNAAVFRGEGKDGGQPAASLNIGGNATVGSLDVNGPASLAAIGDPGAAPAGQGRIYFDGASNKVKVSENGGAFVDLVGAGGVSGSGAADVIPLWSAGTTLGNSLISQVGGTTVQMPAFIDLAPTASGNAIRFGSPNSGTGMTISGPAARADVRLDGTTLRLAAGPGGVGPPGNGIGIDSTTVTLPAFVSLAATASGNNITFGSPNSGTGMTIGGSTNRADIRLDGSVLRLAAGPAGGPPGNGIAITATGNVGIGTTAPANALDANGAVRAVSASGGNVISETTGGTNSWAKLWMKTPSQQWTIGSSNNFNGNQLYFSNESSGLIRMAIMPDGNVGIGTTSPSLINGGSGRLLEISDPNSPGLALRNTSAGGGQYFIYSRIDAGGHSLRFFDASNNADRFVLNNNGNVGIGTTTPVAKLHVIGTGRMSVLEVTGGSDLAEKFSFSQPVKPGMVVAIDPKNAGKLTLSRGAYNRRVAGIISGANNLSVGMLLPDLADGNTAQPVALSGRVWVYCDATKGAIIPGDLLTTSNTSGHAMKVVNHTRAQGSIIGKAMSELKAGRGLVLVLVTLQ